MQANEYSRLLEKAKKDMTRLKTQRAELHAQIAEIDRRIDKQKKGIQGLAFLADQQDLAGLEVGAGAPLAKYESFTDAVSYSLKTVLSSLTPTQVRDRLRHLGYDLKRYKSDPVASIHTILKRLEKAGKVRSERNEIGKIAYRWISEEEKLERTLLPTSSVFETGDAALEPHIEVERGDKG